MFAEHVKKHEKIRGDRARIEDKVATGAAAIATAMNITSTSLKAGMSATLKTEDLSAEKSKAELEKAAAAPVVTSTLAQKKWGILKIKYLRN